MRVCICSCCLTHCICCTMIFWLSHLCLDNTAGILTRRASYSRLHQSVHLVPVVVTDGDHPMQSSTGTLTVRVCTCDREGNMEVCNAENLSSPAGLSTSALITILLCAVILLSKHTPCPFVCISSCHSTTNTTEVQQFHMNVRPLKLIIIQQQVFLLAMCV